MRRLCGVSILTGVMLAACSAPDVGTEISGFENALGAVETSLLPEISKSVQDERDAAKALAIANSQTVYSYPAGCISLGSLLVSEARVSHCALSPAFALSDKRGTALYAARSWDVLKGYLDALQALNGNGAPSLIGQNLGALLAASNGLKQALDTDSEVKVLAESDIKAVASLAQRISESARARAIRRLIKDAHDPIETTIAELIAFESKRDGLSAAAKVLETAHGNLEKAQPSASAQPLGPSEKRAYAAAVTTYEAAFEKFQAVFKDSEARKLLIVWKAQEALHAAATSSDDVIATLEILEDLKLLLKE